MNLGTLFHLSRRLNAVLKASALDHGLEPPLTQGEIITLEFLLAQTGPISIRAIVEHTNIAQSWISAVVKSLMKRGWVDVARDRKDRRTTTVRLKGEVVIAARETLSQSAMPLFQQLAPGTSKHELEAINQCFDQVFALMGREAGAGGGPGEYRSNDAMTAPAGCRGVG